ncbi:MAG TPA: homocysteine S-methyltransferase family protein [Longimicrobiales bacterium]
MNELLRRTRIIIADGAMGTELQAAGLPAGACGELWNQQHPERVRRVHEAYVAAGAEVLLTNTFGGSRSALERHDAAHQVAAINRAAAQNALRAAGDTAWVLGDIGPLGGFLEPLGETPREVAHEAFREQAEALLGAHVDGIIIETMSALDELEVAVAAARAAGARLVVGSVCFENTRVGLRTMTGATCSAVAEKLTELNVDVLATNCGTRLSASDYAQIVRAYREVNDTAPVLVKMNAGSPRLVGEQTVYDMAPDEFAAALPRLIDAGTDIIGGCCGTGPQHVRALARALA